MFDYISNDDESNDEWPLDPYLYDTFRCFVNHTTSIDFDLDTLNEHCENKKLLALLFGEFVKEEVKENNKFIKEYNQQNMIKPKALQIFSRLRYIHFCATNTDYDFGAKYIYPFSIMAVLDLIQTTGLDRIKITFWKNKEFDIVPCLGLFESSSMYSSIQKDCHAKQIKMTIEKTNRGDSMELIFCKT